MQNYSKYPLPIDLTEQTPELHITSEKLYLLYEKAFLSTDREPDEDFAPNTTTWD